MNSREYSADSTYIILQVHIFMNKEEGSALYYRMEKKDPSQRFQ